MKNEKSSVAWTSTANFRGFRYSVGPRSTAPTVKAGCRSTSISSKSSPPGAMSDWRSTGSSCTSTPVSTSTTSSASRKLKSPRPSGCTSSPSIKAVKKLVDLGILIPGLVASAWRLNPQAGWKGRLSISGKPSASSSKSSSDSGRDRTAKSRIGRPAEFGESKPHLHRHIGHLKIEFIDQWFAREY